MNKIVNIVKSRFINGETLPQWYENRLNICSTCEFNSKNVDNKSLGRKSWELVAGAHCTLCNCTLTEKSKIEEESCPKNKWSAITVNMIEESSLYKLYNRSPEKATIKKQGIYYLTDLGTMTYGIPNSIDIEIQLQDATKITSQGSCGCLSTKVKSEGNKHTLNISYNTNLMGEIEGKTVRFMYYKNNIKSEITFLIKGRVIK